MEGVQKHSFTLLPLAMSSRCSVAVIAPPAAAGLVTQHPPPHHHSQVLSFAGELLANAESLLRDGLHPTEIADGYAKAGARALEILDTLVVPGTGGCCSRRGRGVGRVATTGAAWQSHELRHA